MSAFSDARVRALEHIQAAADICLELPQRDAERMLSLLNDDLHEAVLAPRPGGSLYRAFKKVTDEFWARDDNSAYSLRVASLPSCGVQSHLRLVEDE